MIHDAPDDSSSETTYECLQCGAVITSEANPGKCEECGGNLHNRAMALE
ncbi:rubrerythrin-like domain-containing protein [Salinarchaeum chitinilyticum]